MTMILRSSEISTSTSTSTSTSISVVTVTFNNSKGLIQTLASLERLKYRPFEVIIVDGGSSDNTLDFIIQYSITLSNLRYISEADNGIYDAMNKGRSLSKGSVIHYLNAGDIVFGEPYFGVLGPVKLSVKICSLDNEICWLDYVKLRGYGYCHQGLIFPVNHPPYDTRYRIASDFDVIMRTFSNGVDVLENASGGGVQYYLGGVSSNSTVMLDQEIVKIAFRNKGVFWAAYFFLLTALRRLLPRSIRRLCARLLHSPK